MLKNCALLAIITFAAVCTSAQSLKPADPYPLKEGVNRAVSDSLVGTHYWYFYAAPGNSLVTVRLKQATTLYGADMKTALTVTLTDAKRTWRTTKILTANPRGSEVTFAAKNVAKEQTIIVSVTPPNQQLIRMGGDYEVEVTGNVMFNGEANIEDPVIRTYDSKMNNYGTVRFLKDGTIVASDGTRGTWKAFDPDSRIYTVVIGAFTLSVQYRPGYGLVKPGDPNLIVFQELRH